MTPANDPLPDGPRASEPQAAPTSDAPPAARPAPAAAPGPAPSPGAEGSAPRQGSFLVRDGPLMLLALVLAVMIWGLVRDTIEATVKIPGVQVEVEPPPDIVVYDRTRFTTDVTLRGTQGDVDRARAALERSPKIRVRMPVQTTPRNDGTQTFFSPYLFVFPFEKVGVVSDVTPVSVQWERAVERDVPVAQPKIAVPADMRYLVSQVTVDPPRVRVRGPLSVVEGLREIPPDAQDASDWLKGSPDLTIARGWSAGFGDWRRDSAWAGRPGDPRRDPDVLTVLPDLVAGTVRFREVKSEKVEHVLRPLYPADDVSAWEYAIKGGSELTGTNRMTLALKGDAAVLEHMKQFADEWTFAVVLPPPPDTGEEVVDRPLPVHLDAWGTALREKIGRAGGVAPSIEGEANVYVSIKKRP